MAQMYDVTVGTMTDADMRAAWWDYVGRRADSRFVDRPEWRVLLHDLYGITTHVVICRTPAGDICAAACMCHIRSPFFGRSLVSSPFFGRGGLYGDHDAAIAAVLGEVEALARRLGVDFIEFRLCRPLPAPYRVNDSFSDFEMSLADGPEAIWQRTLRSNARQNIRRSRRHDLKFALSRDPGPCCELLQQTLRNHGTPFHGRAFFSHLPRALATGVQFAAVRQAGRVVAAGVVLTHGATVSAPYIGSLLQSRSARANYGQYWGIIEAACARGLRRFDLGRSPRGSSHAAFKLKWGAVERPLYYSYLVVRPGAAYASVSRPTRLQRCGVRVWRCLPVAVTRRLGPLLVRGIP